MKSSPKIIIFGESFHSQSGGGITLSNLFKDWPVEKLAVIVTSNVEYSNFERSREYYRLGSDEYRVVWPLSLFIKSKSVSGEVNISDLRRGIIHNSKSNSGYSRIIKHLIDFLYISISFLGLENVTIKIIVSAKLLKWIKDFNPDYIYFQNSGFQGILFINEIIKVTKIPLAIHPMDDFVVTATPPGLFHWYWNRRMQAEFRKLINITSVRLSICPAMAEEYKNRYGYTFYPFHNPVDVDNWKPFSKTNWEINGTFKIIYTGRLGSDNKDAIHLLCEISDMFQKSKINTEVHLFFSPLSSKYLVEKFRKYSTVKICGFVENDKMPELLSRYDLLFLPLGFSNEALRRTMFSMPTKTAEYLMSGVPIIVNAPCQTALGKYANQEDWAYLVDNCKTEVLSGAIKDLYSNIDLRRSLGNKAIQTAMKNHDSSKVRRQFREMFK